MARIRLFHRNPAEAAARVAALEALGHAVIYRPPTNQSQLTGWRDDAPDAFVVDLTRVPSHGRAMGMALRKSAAARALPLVFVGGSEAAVATVRATLPDAVYTNWDEIGSALEGAFANPVKAPVVPKEMPGATHAALVKKLGIRAGQRVLAIDAPGGFIDWLGDLPEGAEVVARGSGDVLVWFVESAEDLERDIVRIAKRASGAPLWIAWPKRRPDRARSELTMNGIMAVAAALGMSQYKICSMSEDWSAMVFRTKDVEAG